jgi:hypothetical protein
VEGLSLVIPATKTETLDRCLAAVRAAADGPDEVIVVDAPRADGPAAARNTGARRARHDVLVFLDADVLVHADAFTRIRAAFAAEPSLTGVFGAYDDAPADPGVVSGFRNLLHHHVHHCGAGPASTFWSGLGAIRRDAFLLAGGYDAATYPAPSIEDIELGMRLAERGARLRLDPGIRGTHLKRWTLRSMVRTDLRARAIPWMALLLERRQGSTALNLGWTHRASALASVALAAGAATRSPRVAWAGLGVLLALNHRFYRLLARRRGPGQALAGVGLHVLHHLTSVAAVPLALSRRRTRAGAVAGDGAVVALAPAERRREDRLAA